MTTTEAAAHPLQLAVELFAPLTDPGQRVYLPFLVGALLVAFVWSAVAGASLRSLFDTKVWLSPSSQLDMKLWLIKRFARIFGLLVLPLSTIGIAAYVARGMDLLHVRPQLDGLAGWAITAAFSITLFVSWDLSRYVLHRLLHRVPVLWRIHELHHSAEVLTPLTFYRSHPLESLLYQLRSVVVAGVLTGVFFWLFQGRVGAWQLVGVDAIGFALNLFGGNLRHSGVWLSYGPLERWFISPAQHQLHHADGHNRNFGAWLAVWDRWFGSWQAAGSAPPQAIGLGARHHRLADALLLRNPAATSRLLGVSLVTIAAASLLPSPARAAEPTVSIPAVKLAVAATPTSAPRARRSRKPLGRSFKQAKRLARVRVYGRRARRRGLPGSTHEIGSKQLERFEHNDPHRAIAEAPGVYFREEDGYGLRPNIGMRGVSSERSAKITLLEDGVPISPAPYAAPAAYYFPLVTRMSRIDVIKGPAAIRFGPSTVGGAIELISAPIPQKRRIFGEIAGGNTGYGKLHLRYGETKTLGEGTLGWLLEGVGLRSTGFKTLDGGGDTGFLKQDYGLTLRYQSSRRRAGAVVVTARIGHAREQSNETYTGLADKDFTATPLRRYLATERDLMQWVHNSARVRVDTTTASGFTVRGLAYFNDFERDWLKLTGFTSGRSIAQVLANPTAGANSVYYALLTGEGATLSAGERVVLGNNARRFRATGLQLTGRRDFELADTTSLTLDLGFRLHRDDVRRLHTEESWAVQDHALVDRQDRGTNLDADAFAHAAAGWAQGTFKRKALTLTAGLRGEYVLTTWDDRGDATNNADGNFGALIPALGALYKLSDPVAVLVGVHRGFAPVSPGQQGNANPETSWNTELGARWTTKNVRADVVGFWSEYSNLKGDCAFSSGCNPQDVLTEFNGGAVRTVGLEAAFSALLRPTKGWKVPLRASYTWTLARFGTDFLSSNPQWGRVTAGDELPYLPPHQLTLQAGVGQQRWQINAAWRYTSPMRDSAGSSDDDLFTDPTSVVDASAQFAVTRWLHLYATCTNLLNAQYRVSLRPFGARPGMPRFAVVGVKLRWREIASTTPDS